MPDEWCYAEEPRAPGECREENSDGVDFAGVMVFTQILWDLDRHVVREVEAVERGTGSDQAGDGYTGCGERSASCYEPLTAARGADDVWTPEVWYDRGRSVLCSMRKLGQKLTCCFEEL